MSHFPVMVFRNSSISETVEDLLAPYDENLEVERYIRYTKEQAIQCTREEIQRYKDNYYAEYLKDPEAYAASSQNPGHVEYLAKEFPKRLEWTDEQCYENFAIWYDPESIDKDGNIWSEYNPKSKWDWYTEGGRWSKAFKTRNGETFINTIVSKVDFTENIPFACITPDGEWHESGNMGYWGCVTEKKDNWPEEFLKIVSELDEDTTVCVIDCHI